MVDGAQQRLLLAVWPNEATELAGNLEQAQQRGVNVSTLCMAGCQQECGKCHGNVLRYRVPPEVRSRWLVIVADDQEVLADEITPENEALAVRTRQKLLVELAIWYIRHSVALAALLVKVGSRFEDLVDEETEKVLSYVSPVDSNRGWLDQMRRTLTGPESLGGGHDLDS